jgi:hypothetical protein
MRSRWRPSEAVPSSLIARAAANIADVGKDRLPLSAEGPRPGTIPARQPEASGRTENPSVGAMAFPIRILTRPVGFSPLTLPPRDLMTSASVGPNGSGVFCVPENAKANAD